MRESKIQYYPSLSIKENAKKNHVTEAAIRYFIKVNNIDRRYERKQNLIDSCRKYLKKHPHATRTELSKKTGHSLSTLRQYWEYIISEKELTDFDSKKAQNYQLRQLNNFYATHPSCTTDILREETFGKDILEPFCGVGTMSEVLKQGGYNVISYDIVDRGYGEVGDFFEVDFKKREFDIITNPPYDSVIEIVLRCLQICKEKVALLMPLRYLSSNSRYNAIYKNHPPKRVYVYQERIGIAKNADFQTYSDAGANLEIYAWYIWERGYKGLTELRWISNDKKVEKATAKTKTIKLLKKGNEGSLVLGREEIYKASPRVWSFKQAEDIVNGINLRLSNMVGGYPFECGGYHWDDSERLYLCGEFSSNTKQDCQIQQKLVEAKSGYAAKRFVKTPNKKCVRKDFVDFRLQWMLYVVWQKCIGNTAFQELLLKIPEEVVLIENTTTDNQDSASVWGCKNKELVDCRKALEKRIKGENPTLKKKDLNRLINVETNKIDSIGEWRGQNNIGKILMICRDCLRKDVEPPIDYDLLRRSNIYLFGELLTFETK